MRSGNVIVLNGCSSSGKSTILKAIQAEFDSPYLETGLDKFIWMLPDRYLNRPLWDEVLGLATQAGELGNQLAHGMHAAIAALSRAGLSIVADHVLVEQDWIRHCSEMLAELPAYLIGVMCPLDILEERERARQDRTLGQARAQYEIVHRDMAYDLEVDTSKLTAEECARQIADRIGRTEPPVAFKQLKARLAA